MSHHIFLSASAALEGGEREEVNKYKHIYMYWVVVRAIKKNKAGKGDRDWPGMGRVLSFEWAGWGRLLC